MYYVAPETPMISSVIADCPDLVPPQYFGQVYAKDPMCLFVAPLCVVCMTVLTPDCMLPSEWIGY